MFVVAITRFGPNFDAQLPELAQMLGLFPYDLRMRIAGPPPVVVARVPEREAASALMNQLRAWGHGAVGCDESTIIAAEAMHQVRDFQFESRPEGARLHTQAHGHGQVQVDAAEVYALIHAIVVTDQQQTQQRTSKQFSATRAMLTGGLVMARKQDTVSRVTDSEAEERVYLVRGLNGQPNLRDPLLFAQHQLRYSGLGDDIGHSSLESFAALSRRLREFAPHAFHDDRLRTNRRKSSFVGASQDHREGGKIKTATVTSSNASSTDLAVHLILIAHTRGQL